MNVIHTTDCGMFRVIEKDGLFYPQEKHAIALGYGALHSQQEIDEIVKINRLTVQESPFEGWFLGRTCRGVSKGYRNYKTLKSAIAFVDGCSTSKKEGAA